MRRIRQADIIRAEYPSARQRYFSDQRLGLERRALEQNQQQFDEQAKLQRQAMEDAQAQADISQAIAGLGLASQAYPYVKKGVSGLREKLAGTEEAQSTTPAAPMSVAPEVGGGEQAIAEIYKPVYPSYQTNPINTLGLGEAAVLPSYQAGMEALTAATKPAYMTPAYEAMITEGQAAMGAGEAALPAAATEGASSGGGFVAGGGALAAAPYILWDVEHGGPISSTVKNVGENIFGTLGGLMGVGSGGPPLKYAVQTGNPESDPGYYERLSKNMAQNERQKAIDEAAGKPVGNWDLTPQYNKHWKRNMPNFKTALSTLGKTDDTMNILAQGW